MEESLQYKTPSQQSWGKATSPSHDTACQRIVNIVGGAKTSGWSLGILCDRHGIRHVLIPPGEKELQGLVERSHRPDDEELFHRIHPKDLVEFNKLLADHCEWRNSKRRRKALGWKTSNQFLAEYESKKEEVSELKTEEPGKIIQLQKSTTDECVSSDKMAA